jgi:hypothetical protein
MSEESITTRQEAEDVLVNVIQGLAATDAYQEKDVSVLLAYMEEDVKKWILAKIPWKE